MMLLRSGVRKKAGSGDIKNMHGLIIHKFHPSITESAIFFKVFIPVTKYRLDKSKPVTKIIADILCGNTDDHARNHSALWCGKALTLTPAYDICPQGRTGHEASQAMLIYRKGKRN